MGRILAIDYGAVRTGFAWTDPLQIIATALPACDTSEIWQVLTQWITQETIELVLIGMPTRFNGEATHGTPLVYSFSEEFQKRFPDKEQKFWDERLTSKMATQTLIDSGVNRKTRQDKYLINSISATILLQSYLESTSFRS